MCLAVPMRLVEIKSQDLGAAELEGVRYDVNLSLIEEPLLGDYLIVHAGFAIEKLEPDDARETLALFSELQEGMGDFGAP